MATSRLGLDGSTRAPGPFADKTTQTFIEKTASDTLLAVLTETGFDTFEIDITDTLRPALAGVAALTRAAPPSSDTLTLGFAEVASVFKSGTLDLTRSDTLTTTLIESAAVAVVIDATDTLEPVITDTSDRSIASTLQAIAVTDTLEPVVSEVWSIGSFVPYEAKVASDTLAVSYAESAVVVRSSDVDRIDIVIRPYLRIDVSYV